MRYAFILAALLLTGCAGPFAPDAPPHPLITPALALLDSIETPLPWNGKTMREWRQRVPIRTVVMEEWKGAVWDGDAILINASLTYDAAGLAGVIAHELRHADGMRHECGPEGNQDRRSTPWSAYAVQIWVLRQLGEEGQAVGNEGGFCD